MTERVLWISAMVLADLYFFWTVLRAPSTGEISTKWGTLYKSEHPTRFWVTLGFQFVLAAIVFPIVILKIATGQPID